MRALLVVVAVLALGAPARADIPVGVIIAGEPTMQQRVHAQADAWLDKHGYTAIASPLAKDATSTFLNCFVIEDMTCARGTFEGRSKADSLVLLRIEMGGGDVHELSLTGYWFVRDHDAVAEKRWCKHCDDAALQQAVDKLLTLLASSSGLGKGRLAVHSKPEGLTVTVDDVSIGVTPVEHDLTPGPHRIKLKRGDRTVGSKTVKIELGSTREVSIPVVEGGSEDEPDHPRPAWRSRPIPVALMGGGAAVVIAGGVFLIYGHKGGPDAPLVYPDATRNGIVLTLLGAGSIAAGAVLWVRASHAKSTPTVSIGPTGTTIGWAGRF
jgi:hypothetical protein